MESSNGFILKEISFIASENFETSLDVKFSAYLIAKCFHQSDRHPIRKQVWHPI